jgi:two-component system, NarL family, sensor histidine kinase UhpB
MFAPHLSRARADAGLVLFVTLLAAALCVHFNMSELLRGWTAPWERVQLDELPPVLFVLAVALAWFAARRYAEAGRELARRRAAEGQLAHALEDNRRLAQQYLQRQEAERKALARELHDELGQYLNIIKLDAASMREDPRVPGSPLETRAAGIVASCSHVQRVLAALIRQLRPVGLDELGLAAAIEHCIDTWRGRLKGVELRLRVDGELSPLPEPLALTVYRLVQEALTNVAKHAAASRVDVRIERRRGPPPDQLYVEIRDNGRGRDLEQATPGLGLIGMRERVAALAGSLELTSTPGHGMSLRARIPVGESS